MKILLSLLAVLLEWMDLKRVVKLVILKERNNRNSCKLLYFLINSPQCETNPPEERQ